MQKADAQKLLLTGTEERSGIFRQIFNTGLYQKVQEQLKVAAREQWNEYSGLKKSIGQYMDSIVCGEETNETWETRFKMKELKKEKFEGRVGEGLALLEDLCNEDGDVLEKVEAEMEGLDRKIEQENQLIGNIRHTREQLRILEENQRQQEKLQEDIAGVEKKYVWMKSLSDTANGQLSGKQKIGAGDLYSDDLVRSDSWEGQCSASGNDRRAV